MQISLTAELDQLSRGQASGTVRGDGGRVHPARHRHRDDPAEDRSWLNALGAAPGPTAPPRPVDPVAAVDPAGQVAETTGKVRTKAEPKPAVKADRLAPAGAGQVSPKFESGPVSDISDPVSASRRIAAPEPEPGNSDFADIPAAVMAKASADAAAYLAQRPVAELSGTRLAQPAGLSLITQPTPPPAQDGAVLTGLGPSRLPVAGELTKSVAGDSAQPATLLHPGSGPAAGIPQPVPANDAWAAAAAPVGGQAILSDTRADAAARSARGPLSSQVPESSPPQAGTRHPVTSPSDLMAQGAAADPLTVGPGTTVTMVVTSGPAGILQAHGSGSSLNEGAGPGMAVARPLTGESAVRLRANAELPPAPALLSDLTATGLQIFRRPTGEGVSHLPTSADAGTNTGPKAAAALAFGSSVAAGLPLGTASLPEPDSNAFPVPAATPAGPAALPPGDEALPRPSGLEIRVGETRANPVDTSATKPENPPAATTLLPADTADPTGSLMSAVAAQVAPETDRFQPVVSLPPPVPFPAPDVARQMALAMPHGTTADAAPVELVLSPAELGTVRMVLHTSGDSVLLIVRADRAETHDMLRRHSDILAEELRSSGFTNVSFDFAQQRRNPQHQPQPQPLPIRAAQAYGSAPPPGVGPDLPRPQPAQSGSGLDLRL